MNILIINSSLHHKNKIGLEFMLNYLHLEYRYGNVDDIQHHDVIYSPSLPIDSSKYPTKCPVPVDSVVDHFSLVKAMVDYAPISWIAEMYALFVIAKDCAHCQIGTWVYNRTTPSVSGDADTEALLHDSISPLTSSGSNDVPRPVLQ